MQDTASEDARARLGETLQAHLAEANRLRRAAETDPALQAARQALRQWQAARLARTHADLLASPRYGAAARFFLDELYGGGDLSERDHEIARVVPKVVAMLPEGGLRVVTLALELDALSERLDAAMVDALGGNCRAGGIDAAAWAAAYRACDNHAARARQIELTLLVGGALDALTRKPLIGVTLRMMRAPAALAGLASLHAFLESGYQSFAAMKGADEFVAAIVGRERAIMQAVFAGDDSVLQAAG